MDGSPLPLKRSWWSKVLLRGLLFTWSAALGKILILNNLRKQHVFVVDWYCMCKRSVEFVDQLLHFEVASALWGVNFSRIGTSWVMVRRVVDLFTCWRWLYDIS
jgi:hypothetical protein